jgi:predicted nucleotidyltransferase
MSVTTVQQAFEEFEKSKVRVPNWQNDRAKEVHPAVRAAVETALGDLFKRAFLAGSYARKVQTVRLKDVDIIIVLNDPDGTLEASADAALERLREAAKTCELVELPTRKGCRAVKLTIKGEEFTIDLVAALEDAFGNIRLARVIPADDLDDWTSAHPQGQLDAHWQKNEDTEGVYLPAVRIVKYWNQRTKYKGKNALPSYLAESILFHAMSAKVDFDEAVLAFFRATENHLSSAIPSVTCPGSPSNYVDERLDDERREAALKKVQEALAHAEAAVAESDAGAAMDLWVKVFGDAFPAPSGDTSALAAALRSGTAVVKGASISTVANGGRPIIESRPWREQS